VQEKKGRGKSEKEGKHEKGRRIELSLKLKHLYDGLSIDAVHEGQVIQNRQNRPKYTIFTKARYFLLLLLVRDSMLFFFVQNLLLINWVFD